MTYSAAFKARVVQGLMGSRAVSAHRLVEAVGVSHETLPRCLREACSVHGMPSPKQRTSRWTSAEKLLELRLGMLLQSTPPSFRRSVAPASACSSQHDAQRA